MRRTVGRGAVLARLIPLLLLLAATSVPAGVRTRELPELLGRVEPSASERAARAAGSRIHVLAETERGARARLERARVRLLRPAGGDLWLVSLPAESLLDAPLPPGIVRVWDLRPEDRTAPGLTESLAARPAGARVPLRIKVFRDEDPRAARDAALALGGEVLLEASRLGILDVSLPREALATLASRDDVRWIELAPPPPADANNGMRIDAEINAVQSMGIDGTGSVIGMWDGGLADTTHPDLAGRVIAGEGGMLTQLHPTHVAGVAAGDGTNSQLHGGGGLQWRGVATGASVVGYTNVGTIAEVESAIALYGIDLANNSWVYPVGPANCASYGDYASDAPEFDEIVTGVYGKRIPVVFAAGNERDDGDCGIPERGGYASIPPPATAKNVIAVGAHFSDAGHQTDFSSWGPTDDGRLKPDLSAPGCQLSGDFGIKSTAPGGGYLALCGTSQSAPAVSGSLAALLQEWRARFAGEPLPSTHKALLVGFAKDRGPGGPDYRFGWGALHLYAGVVALQTASTIEDGVDDAEVDSWTFHVAPSTDTLRVTLVWDDPAAAELASPALVNDLDLVLIGPTSGTHLPFVLDPANPDSTATLGVNVRDNVEQVRVLSPEGGPWTALVTGTSVPQGPQAYSLVGIDGRPPADVAQATAQAIGPTTVALSWIRPGDADRAGTLVVRSLSPISWTPDDGTAYTPGSSPAPGVVVLAADDADHSTTPLEDFPVPADWITHYGWFAYDEIPNYSPGVFDTAATGSPPVEAPSTASAPVAPRFFREGASPIGGAVRLAFELPAPAWVTIDVHDAAGRRVGRVVSGPQSEGLHRVTWDGRRSDGRALASGVYFLRFRTEGLVATEKVVLLR